MDREVVGFKGMVPEVVSVVAAEAQGALGTEADGAAQEADLGIVAGEVPAAVLEVAAASEGHSDYFPCCWRCSKKLIIGTKTTIEIWEITTA